MSAIITTYNHENYIAEAIDSLLSQDYRPLQLIVVDDGSDDSTSELAVRYSSRDVEVHSKRNGGPSSALNKGIDIATGDIIAILSGDDVALPGRVSRQVNIICSGHAEIVTSIPFLIDGSGSELHGSVFPVFAAEHGTMQPIALLRRLFYEGNFICAPSVAITRSALSVIGPFNEGLLQLQDFEYWIRAACHGFSIHIDSAPMIKYRIHDRNLSSAQNTNRADREHLYVLRRFGAFASCDTLQSILWGSSLSSCGVELPKNAILAQVYLRHSSPSIRQIGFELVIDLLASESGRALIAKYFDMSPAAVWRMLASV